LAQLLPVFLDYTPLVLLDMNGYDDISPCLMVIKLSILMIAGKAKSSFASIAIFLSSSHTFLVYIATFLRIFLWRLLKDIFSASCGVSEFPGGVGWQEIRKTHGFSLMMINDLYRRWMLLYGNQDGLKSPEIRRCAS